ncbi:hypothetical protein AB0C13_39155, partial [Streptomyces sp. NPDC049099]
MKPSSEPPAAPAPLVIESSVVEGLPAEGALLLRMSGSLDAAGAEAWSAELRGHLEEEPMSEALRLIPPTVGTHRPDGEDATL